MDLVARKSNTVAVVEVRSRSVRSLNLENITDLISERKKQCLRRGARSVYQKLSNSLITVRLDLAICYRAHNAAEWNTKYFSDFLDI